MSVGKDDFHLRRLIAVELKLESFQPAHVGQMELYLRWLDKHERAPGEEAPIGLILCAAADAEQVELLRLDAKSIRVSEYLAASPPCRRCRCCANGCTRRWSTPGNRRPGACLTRRVARDAR
jgi:YhcG PDDEXK nuclease domain